MLGDSRKQREGSRAGVGQFLDRGDTKMVGKHCYHLRISVDYLGFPHFSSGLGQLSSHEFRFGWIWKIRRIGLWACFFSPRTPFDVEHIYIYISQIEPYTNHTHTHIYINHILTMYFQTEIFSLGLGLGSDLAGRWCGNAWNRPGAGGVVACKTRSGRHWKILLMQGGAPQVINGL